MYYLVCTQSTAIDPVVYRLGKIKEREREKRKKMNKLLKKRKKKDINNTKARPYTVL